MKNEESRSTTPDIIKDSWQTARPIHVNFDKKYNFTADVAASKVNALNKNFITIEENALITPWNKFDNDDSYVWCNPPYSDIGPWIKRATNQRDEHKIGCVMLLPNQTSTEWFRNGVDWADELIIVTSGRFSFVNAITQETWGNPRLGSIFFIWHKEKSKSLKISFISRDKLMKKN